MSFLQQLQQKRAALQATTTTVTTATGERYIEGPTGVEVKLEKRSYGFVVDTKPDAVPACILPDFLYLGSQDAVTVENISTYQISHILSVGIETPETDNATQKLFLPCLDLPETQLFAEVVPRANEYIEDARLNGGHVLVHCNAGVSRSASVVIAYLLQQCDMSFDAAFALVKAKRACAQPNAGFMQQLREFKAMK